MKLAGPFLGEFGWQVAIWVPWLRWMQQNLWQDLHVVCQPGHEHLYEDFAAAIKPSRSPNIIARDCVHAFMRTGRMNKDQYHSLACESYGKKVAKRDFCSPLEVQYVWLGNQPPQLKRAAHHTYGNPSDKRKALALHIRKCTDKQPERNWDPGDAERVASHFARQGYEIILVGSLEDSVGFQGIPDFRGKPIKDLVGPLSQCIAIIGPSSGPLPLANACGTPALWWSANHKDVRRFESAWNPSGLPNKRVADSWTPTHGEVIESVEACLKSF